MTQILVVDDTAIFREPIAAALRHRGYRATGACDGQDALNQVRQKRPDLILLDMAMPVMDGMTMLRELQADPKTRDIPVIVLSAISEEQVTQKARKLGACGYLLKSSFSLNELFQTVSHHLPKEVPQAVPSESRRPAATFPDRPAAPASASETDTPLSSIKPLLSAAQARQHLEVCEPLSGYSPAIARLLQITGDSRSDTDQVIEAIAKDPSLAFRLRRLTNSPVFPGYDPAESLRHGIHRVGIPRIHQSVLNIGIIEHFAGRPYSPVVDNRLFWEHAVAVGLIAAEISSVLATAQLPADQAFTMGLLHDLGRLILLEQMPEPYQQAWQTAESLQLPLEPVERRMLGCTHVSVMDAVLHNWNYSADVIDPIVLHHLPISLLRQCPTEFPRQVAVLGLADNLAQALLMGNSGEEHFCPLEDSLDYLQLPEGTLERIVRDVPNQTHQLKLALLGQAFGGIWPAFIDKLHEEFPVPIRPMYVGTGSGTDAFAIFCRRWIDSQNPQPCNVALMHVEHASEAEMLGKRLEISEREQGLRKLPLVIVSKNGQPALPGRVLADRRHKVVRLPATARLLLKSMSEVIRPS